jgi:hypothetical protein
LAPNANGVLVLSDVRAGLYANLQTIRLDGEDLQITQYMLGGPTFPTIEVAYPEKIEYDVASIGGAQWIVFVVRAMIGLTTDQGAQYKLDQLLDTDGPASVKAALESDTTLGGACDDIRVSGASGYMVYPRHAGDVLGADWSVDIYV